MNATDISGEFNDSLHGDAEQFGGSGNSAAVPTHHIRITSGDLAEFVDTKEPLLVSNVAFVWRSDPPENEPVADFVGFVTKEMVDQLVSGDVINFGVRHINGENRTLHVSKGGISDLFEDDRSPEERIRQEEPHLREYL